MDADATTLSEPAELDRTMKGLVDEYRSRCLWFLRPDYYPVTVDERLRVLGYIERHGNLDAFKRAAALRQWLSRSSSETSVDS